MTNTDITKEHYIVYGEWKVFDDEGEVERLDCGQDGSSHTTIKEAKEVYDGRSK